MDPGSGLTGSVCGIIAASSSADGVGGTNTSRGPLDQPRHVPATVRAQASGAARARSGSAAAGGGEQLLVRVEHRVERVALARPGRALRAVERLVAEPGQRRRDPRLVAGWDDDA